VFEGFRRDRAQLADVTIEYVVGGSGAPVLLLHGYPQNLSMWARVAPILAQRFTVVCADLRGYGDSSKPASLPDSSNYSFRAMAADQLALMHGLGCDRFSAVGHDRGGRVAHRLALDCPDTVARLAVLDIVPTYAMFMETDRHRSRAYWHWYFLAQPAPFPERLIGADPDFFYETCLVGWGATRLEDFDQEMLADYRRCWRDPQMIHATCADYRAGGTVDLEHDAADIQTKVTCPTLAFWGSKGLMHKLWNIEEKWRERCAHLQAASLAGGHFFVEQFPEETAGRLLDFLKE
jgi:haloacetate dehalogenase